MTKLQQAAYDAQLAADLPVSELAGAVLIKVDGTIDNKKCASYLYAVQQMDWFKAAFPGHVSPVTVVEVAGGLPVTVTGVCAVEPI